MNALSWLLYSADVANKAGIAMAIGASLFACAMMFYTICSLIENEMPPPASRKKDRGAGWADRCRYHHP